MGRKNRIPVFIDPVTRTRYIQSKTGLMRGRKKVRGYGDRTSVIRIRKGFDERGGEILGRTKPIPLGTLKRYKRRKRKDSFAKR